jgi:hypothetical protein
LLDRFFHGELLPRFEQARALRQESVARKIGALRESVMAALETSIDRARRNPGKQDVDVAAMEMRLRVITGEVGELLTRLDHVWLEFGESPERVIDQLTKRATHAGRSGQAEPVSGIRVSEWLHDIVQEFLAEQLQQLRSALKRAVSTLQEVAQELGSTETPSDEELDRLLRDAPRFEFARIPEDLHAGRWKWLGESTLRSSIRSQLRDKIGPALKEELHLYGLSLRGWSDQVLKRVGAFHNSYADAYRIQIQRVSGHSQSSTDVPAMDRDLERLRDWGSEATSEVVSRRA